MARILVLQEIAENVQRIRSTLSEHELLLFGKQSDAMRFLNRDVVDLIICAVHLVNDDVFEFLRWVKSRPATRDAKFVLFCAEPSQIALHVSEDICQAARALGANGFITMELFDADAFRKHVGAVLNCEPGRETFVSSSSFNINAD